MLTNGLTIPAKLSLAEEQDALNGFEEKYIRLRQKENRLYTDAELLALPRVPSTHPHAAEWNLRKRSATRLVQWLADKRKPLRILEAGCGNGWLAHQLATIPESTVTGSDINFTELEQAARVFAATPNLYFVCGDIRGEFFREQHFDSIVMAASIQYFPSLQGIISAAMNLLTPGGELHILDTPFYRQEELPAARIRTAEHFRNMGFPEMSEHYFHHSWNELNRFQYRLLYDPTAIQHFFSRQKNPFPWICLTKQNQPA